MVLLDRAQWVRDRLSERDGVTIDEISFSPPATASEIADAERAIGHRFPEALRDAYTMETGKARLLWTAERDAFGRTCRYGDLELLSPSEVAANFAGLRDMAETARRDYDLNEYPGWAAIARDWSYWVPVFAFGNGDYFCLDVRKGAGNYPVVFLVHDTMWEEPISHGTQVASSVSDLLMRWSQIGFVFRFSWMDALDSTGIDVDAAVLQPLRAALGS